MANNFILAEDYYGATCYWSGSSFGSGLECGHGKPNSGSGSANGEGCGFGIRTGDGFGNDYIYMPKCSITPIEVVMSKSRD